VRDAWEVETTGLFCEHSDVFLETWPTSGMTRNGMAYALPISVPRTADTGSSSLLPTPEANTASNGGSQHPDKRRMGGHSVNLQDVAEHLLPTPTSRDHKGANQRGDTSCLTGALLPTPRATRGGSATETVMLLPTPTSRD
jgi:hypothetical protein